jgi:hypothetical protein
MRSPIDNDDLNAPVRLRATRRAFLGWAGSTAAFTTLASLQPLTAAATSATANASAGFCDEGETEILTQIMERMVDTGLPDAPQVRDTGAIATVESLCAGLDPSVSGPLPLLMRGFEYAPILLDFTFTRFTQMTDAEKDVSLETWRTSRLHLRRLAFLAVRNLCFFGWYAQPEIWPLIGYQGPLLPGNGAAS